MTIYITLFDPVTKRGTSASTDSGFATLDEVAACMGDAWATRSGRLIVYPEGVAFSNYPFLLTDPSASGTVAGTQSSDGGE